jgi:hypothetical protein
MDSPIIPARPDTTVATTQPRVTPTPARGAFKQVLAQSLVRGAEAAMKILPGGPLMAVAVRGGGGPGSALGLPMTGMGSAVRGGASPEGPGGGALRSGPLGAAVAPASLGGAITGASGAQPGAGAEGGGLESSLQQSQEMNLYYLQVQEAVNSQNRSFTALSNVLKAEHDTVKTAIGNIR